MPTCKHSVIVSTGGRYTQRCGVETTQALVWSSVLDDGFIIQTQMPICSAHMYDKVELLKMAGTPSHTVNL